MRAFGFERVPQSGQVEDASRNASTWWCSRHCWRVFRSCLASRVSSPDARCAGVLLAGDEVSNGFFMAIIAAHDELEFDAHGRAPPGLSSW